MLGRLGRLYSSLQAPICIHSKGFGCVLQIRRPIHSWFIAFTSITQKQGLGFALAQGRFPKGTAG